MILEEDRKTRDYLFGRLLAVAEHIEQVALNISQEKRDTNAAKLMQRFRERPASTWVVLYVNHLPPYQSRVRSRWPGYHEKLKDIIDKITLNFVADDFISDRCLGGEFLLGYSCQRQKLH